MDEELAQRLEEARLVLDARKELYGEADSATVDAMLELARALRDAASYREAESVLRASLSIQNRAAEIDEARITRQNSTWRSCSIDSVRTNRRDASG